jgi:hypothetical protein
VHRWRGRARHHVVHDQPAEARYLLFPVAATRVATTADPANNASVRAANPGHMANRFVVILLGPDSDSLAGLP